MTAETRDAAGPAGLASLFAAAAAAIETGADAARPIDPTAAALLADLGYALPGGAPCPSAVDRNPAALLRIAARCDRVFRLPARAAPGAIILGAELRPAAFGLVDHPGAASLSGRGTTLRQAFESCIGEGAELLSFLEWGDEPAVGRRFEEGAAGQDEAARRWLAGRLSDGTILRDGALSWLPARHLADGAPALLPRDLCLRRPPGKVAAGRHAATSAGCAAGPTPESAALSALLELVERDAAALWWHGGSPPAAIPQALLDSWGIPRFLHGLRDGADTPRATILLDITSDIGIPVVAAASHDAAGRTLAFGLAADPDPAAAVRSAVLELCQMELAQELVGLKRRQRGAEGLNEADRRIWRRMTELEVSATPPLQVESTRVGRMADGRPALPRPWLPSCIERVERRGLVAIGLDLSRAAIGVPALRVVVPGLQELPPIMPTPRLAACLECQDGSGAEPAISVPLI